MLAVNENGEGSDSEEESNGEEVRAAILQEDVILSYPQYDDFEEDDYVQDFEQKRVISSDQTIPF